MKTATSPPSLRASIVISTKNRQDELRRALESAFAQSVQTEVIVIDDGSADGTSGMVRAQYPRARLIRFDSSAGYMVRRNYGMTIATAPIVFSIDDDAVFSSQNIVEQTLREFSDPRIGAIAVPYIDVGINAAVQQRAPREEGIYVADTFRGTAAALRRDVFLQLGGYRERLVHQGEEGDYCLRMLATGYVVRLGCADPIHHFESPKRDTRRMDYYGRRNDVLFAWHNVPALVLPFHLSATMVSGFLLSLRLRRPWHMGRGLFGGIAGIFRYWKFRFPVAYSVYWLNRKLKKRGPCLLNEIEKILPATSGMNIGCHSQSLSPAP